MHEGKVSIYMLQKHRGELCEWLHPFLTSEQYVGEWLALYLKPLQLYSRE